ARRRHGQPVLPEQLARLVLVDLHGRMIEEVTERRSDGATSSLLLTAPSPHPTRAPARPQTSSQIPSRRTRATRTAHLSNSPSTSSTPPDPRPAPPRSSRTHPHLAPPN